MGAKNFHRLGSSALHHAIPAAARRISDFSLRASIASMHSNARKRYRTIETIAARRLMLLAESSTFTTLPSL
jgi:hypothetical protein